jgi:type IV secretion system protein VirD4
MSIYIGVAPGDIARVAPLLRLFFDAVLNVNTSKTPQQDPNLCIPTLLLMDEFAQLGRMDRLAHALQYARGYGLRFALVVQNRAQIMDTYGNYAASDIFDNVGVEMVYGTGDEKLAKQLEERLGNTTMNVITHNRPRWFAWAKPSRQTEAEHPHRRPLMLASEIMQMQPDDQLILRPGMKPIRAKKIRWWQEPEFLDRQGPTPTIPKLEVLIAMDDGVSLSRPHRIAATRRS